MTRAVVLLIATLLFASLGAVAQNSSSPSGGGSAPAQATAPPQNTSPAATSNAGDQTQPATTHGPSRGIESPSPTGSQQDKSKDPRTASSAELPQTSTILPLLGLLGLGSLVAGLFARR